ncbi:MAG TPA: trypsin-like peptidase domain-containing protein [Pseudonocardia sp.]|uniref:S1C family serine protease n=1 Tax=Pseudonocardia sp. TaxID=60912 RepID=UPI002EDA8C26
MNENGRPGTPGSPGYPGPQGYPETARYPDPARHPETAETETARYQEPGRYPETMQLPSVPEQNRGEGPWYPPPPPPGGFPPPDPWPAPPPRRRNPVAVFGALLVVLVLAVAAFVVGQRLWSDGGLPSLSAPDTSSYSVQPAPPGVPEALDTRELGALAKKVSPGLVNINTELGYQGAASAGTGMVLTSDGQVLTNNHVINGATSIRVTNIGNGRTYRATVIGYDRSHDIAVLQLRGASGLKTATLGDSTGVAVGDPIAAIGNAGGVGGPPTTSGGTVTALNRSVNPRDELTGSTERLTGLIEVAANVQPGDSGGPLVDSQGRVIGVNTAASANYRYQSTGATGFAIPINSAMTVVRQIQAGQSSDTVHIGPTGMLGVSVVSGPATQFDPGVGTGSERRRTVVNGVTVAGVQAGSPAEQAGLEQGDVIVGLDGSTVDSATTLTNLIGHYKPGDQVAVQWIDSLGQRQSATVALIPGPPS